MIKTNFGNNNHNEDFNDDYALANREDAILNKSQEGSERDEDIEDIDALQEDTSRAYNQLE